MNHQEYEHERRTDNDRPFVEEFGPADPDSGGAHRFPARSVLARGLRRPRLLGAAAAVIAAGASLVTWQAVESEPTTTASSDRVLITPPAGSVPVAPDRSERADRDGRPTVPRTTARKAPKPVPKPAPTTAKPAPPKTTAPTPPPVTYRVEKQYVPVGTSFSGEASFYGGGDGFDGGLTASGEIFDASQMTAAHQTLPFGTRLNVCYQGGCVVVRINDRGPYSGDRIIDLSAGAAAEIGMTDAGVGYVTATPVELRTVRVPVR